MSVAMLLSSIADCLNVQSRYSEAEAAARQALALFKKAMGPNHPRRADIVGSLGDALDWEGRSAEAGHELRERVEICNKAFGQGQIRTLRASIRLAEWEARFGSPKNSLARVMSNKVLLMKASEKGTADWGMNERAEGYAREAIGDIGGARTAFEESSRNLTSKLGVNHWQTKVSTRALANIH